VSVTEPSDAVNAGMPTQTEGRRLALSRKSPRPQLTPWLVGWLAPDTDSLSGSDTRYTARLIASRRSGQEENCSKDGYAGSPPEQEK
jgi:hypothetical protein